MPNYTENFNLIKPLPKDQYDIQHFNDNMDILDGTLKSHQEQITSTKEEIDSTLASMQRDIDTIEQNTSEEVLKNKIDEALLDSLDEKIATEVSSEIDNRSLVSQETFNPVQEKVSTLETNFNQTNETVAALSDILTETQESIATINETNTAQNEKISNLEEDVQILDPEAIKEMKEMQNDLNAKMYAHPGLVLKFSYITDVSITINADQPLFLMWGDDSPIQTIKPNTSTKLTHSFNYNNQSPYCVIYSIYDFKLISFSCSATLPYDYSAYSEIWICDKILSLPNYYFLESTLFKKVYFISKNLTSIPNYCLNYASSSYVYLADNISQFGYRALSSMSNLKTITLPESLTNYNTNFLMYNPLASVYFRQPEFNATSSSALYRESKEVIYYSTNTAVLEANVLRAYGSFSYDKSKITYQQLEEITNVPDKDILSYIPKWVDTYLELLKPSEKTTELESQINTLNSNIDTLKTELKTDISLLKTKDTNLQQQLDYLFIAMFPTFASRLSFKYNIGSSTLRIPQLSQNEQYGVIKYNDMYSGSTLLNKPITSPTLSSSSGSITIASSYLDLIDELFKDNTYITSIDLSQTTLNTFGEGVFSGCTSLTSATLSENLKYIPNYTFSSCSVLQQINFPETLITIGEEAFFNNVHLQSKIDLTNCRELRTIGAGAFNGCSNLSEMKLPYTTFSIQENAFANCGRLDLYFDGSASDWTAMVSLATDWNKNSTIVVFDANGKTIPLE